MNCFLVRLRHSYDDLPLFISTDRETAIAFARVAPWQPAQDILDVLVTPYVSTPELIDVVEFLDGVPVKVTKVRDWDEEHV